MVSTVKVDVVAPRVATGTTTLGISGDKLLIPSGVTITNSGTQSGFSTPTGLNSVQVFTASATWTKPTDITKVVVEVQGAGGSGSAAVSYYGGGGGGGFSKKLLDVSSVTASTITIGAGGVAVGPTNPGNAGGLSSWADSVNTDVVGNGGGGHPQSASSGAGGTATGGDIQITGGNGWGGNAAGATMYGSTAGMNTEVGQGYGSGGGHGYTTYNSGPGAAGIVIVWEYK